MSAPPVSVRCNVRPCALDTDIAPLPLPYAAWSSCSVACGGGVRTRTAACAPASACATLLPPQYQPCGTRPCARYEWRAQGWCSAERDADRIVALTCGGGGVWEREVMCVDAARARAGGSDAPALAEYQCDGPKPSSVRLQNRSRYAPDRASSHPGTVGAAGAIARGTARGFRSHFSLRSSHTAPEGKVGSTARSAQATALSWRARVGVRSCDAVDEPLALTVGLSAGAPTLSIAVGVGTADPAPAVDGASVTALAIQYDVLSYLNALDLPAQVTVSTTDRSSRLAASHLALCHLAPSHLALSHLAPGLAGASYRPFRSTATMRPACTRSRCQPRPAALPAGRVHCGADRPDRAARHCSRLGRLPRASVGRGQGGAPGGADPRRRLAAAYAPRRPACSLVAHRLKQRGWPAPAQPSGLVKVYPEAQVRRSGAVRRGARICCMMCGVACDAPNGPTRSVPNICLYAAITVWTEIGDDLI